MSILMIKIIQIISIGYRKVPFFSVCEQHALLSSFSCRDSKIYIFWENLLYVILKALCVITFSETHLRVLCKISPSSGLYMYNYNRISIRQRKLPLAASSGNSRTNLSNSNKRYCCLIILPSDHFTGNFSISTWVNHRGK